jgi:hypothetical protein
MKKFKTYKGIREYAIKVDSGSINFDKTVTIKHQDGSVLKLTNCKYEKVKDTTWECEVLGKNFKLLRTIVGENVHIIWSEHHGYFVYYNSDLKKIQIDKQ